MAHTPKKIICTVTNDLNYDQRMIKICSTLQALGYEVTLVGRLKSNSPALQHQPFHQKRLKCWADSGKLFYLSYWINLFFYLLFKRADILCAIDLDTIMPVLYVAKIKGVQRVYDAHEIFTEIPELVHKPREYKIWKWIGQHAIPQFPKGYTVGHFCAQYFKEHYNANYEVVTNATVLDKTTTYERQVPGDYMLYQGAVNKGRAFDILIPAMKLIDIPLVICGEGSYMEEVKALIKTHQVEDKVKLVGYVKPSLLPHYTSYAKIGILLLDPDNKNNVFSMANRLFDYMHHGVPQLSMDYPEYRMVNEDFEIATLLPGALTPEIIAAGVERLLNDQEYYNRLQQNSLRAREKYCWQAEAEKLKAFYQQF